MKQGAAVGQSQQMSVQDKPATQATQNQLASLADREDFLDADYQTIMTEARPVKPNSATSSKAGTSSIQFQGESQA